MDFSLVIGLMQAHWKDLGLTPLYLFKLIERGWTYEEICFVLGNTIGGDFANINVTTWIDRLIAKGVEVDDDSPLVQLLDKLMFVYLEVHGDELVGQRRSSC